MAIIRCDKGHYYDNTKFSQCPHCGVLPVMEREKEKDSSQPVVKAKAKPKPKLFSLFHRGEEKKQEPLAQQEPFIQEEEDSTIAMAEAASFEDDDCTVAMPAPLQEQSEFEDDDRTIAMPSSSQPSYDEDDDDRTIAIPASAQPSYDEDDDRTIAIPSASRAVSYGSGSSMAQAFEKPAEPAAPVSEPGTTNGKVQKEVQPQAGLQQSQAQMYAGFVVGWLVCINGDQKGRDYRLCRGFNRLGGSDKMDIAVKGDPKLGDFASCAIVYDDKSNEFFAVKQEDEHVFVNEEGLKGAVKLTSGDRIKAGDSEFEFIAFCREGRIWDSYE